MISPKPLTLVTFFHCLDSFPWFLSFSPWVTQFPLTIHMLITLMSVLSAQTALLSCMPHAHCLQDNLHLTDVSSNISKMEPITFSLPHQPDVSYPWDFVPADSSAWRLFLFPLTLWPLHLPNCYSSSRSHVRCHFPWEVFLDTSSLSQVLL